MILSGGSGGGSGSVSGVSPISYNSGTGAISLTTVPVSLGGTGQTTKAADANAIGIFALTNNVPSTDVPGYTGQWGISPNGFVYKSTGTNAGNWGQQGLIVGGGLDIGDPANMSADHGAANAYWYTAGRADSQNVAQAGRNMQVWMINCNPFDTGSGIGCGYVSTTNHSGSTLLNTNTDGQNVYLVDPVACSYMMTPEQLAANLLPSTALIVTDGFPVAVATATANVGGISGNYSGAYFDFPNSITHFPQWVAGKWIPSNLGWIDAMSVNHSTGVVKVPVRLNVTGDFYLANTKVNGGGSGPQFFDPTYLDPIPPVALKRLVLSSNLDPTVPGNPITLDIVGNGSGWNYQTGRVELALIWQDSGAGVRILGVGGPTLLNCYTDFAIITAGRGLKIKGGTNARVGTATLVAGTITVANTSVASTDLLFISRITAGGTIGQFSYTLSAGASFTINSSTALDTSTVAWELRGVL